MKFSAVTLTTLIAGIACLSVQGFSPSIGAVVNTQTNYRTAAVATRQSRGACNCPACTGARSVNAGTRHASGCQCGKCLTAGFGGLTSLLGVQNDLAEGIPLSRNKRCMLTRLFADATDEATTEEAEGADDSADTVDEVKYDDAAEKEGMSDQERHNVERPQRQSLSKKRPGAQKSGKPLTELNKGDSFKATVKSVTTYGAFCDFGAETDGLLHISRMSKGFVSDASEIVSVGDEIDIRVFEINMERNQVALTLLTEEEENEAKQGRNDRSAANSKRGGGARRQNQDQVNSLLTQVREKGYDSNQWIDGVVASTPSFGAFVRIDAKLINEELEGSFDGLVHISSLTDGRADSVEQYAKIDQQVKVRIKSVGTDGKVALTMTTVEYELEQAARGNSRGREIGGEDYGNKNWKADLKEMEQEVDMPEFLNPIALNFGKYEKNVRGRRQY